MAVIRINELPEAATPVASNNVAIDGAMTQRTTIQELVDVGSPIPTEAEARAGANNTKRMTPLRVKQSIDEEIGNTIASIAQGDKADTAMQPAIYDPLGVAGDAFDRRNWGAFNTEAAFVAASIKAAVLYADTAGYYQAGDGGGHRKVRCATPSPVEAWHKQSADGAWWVIADDRPADPRWFGYFPVNDALTVGVFNASATKLTSAHVALLNDTFSRLRTNGYLSKLTYLHLPLHNKADDTTINNVLAPTGGAMTVSSSGLSYVAGVGWTGDGTDERLTIAPNAGALLAQNNAHVVQYVRGVNANAGTTLVAQGITGNLTFNPRAADGRPTSLRLNNDTATSGVTAKTDLRFGNFGMFRGNSTQMTFGANGKMMQTFSATSSAPHSNPVQILWGASAATPDRIGAWHFGTNLSEAEYTGISAIIEDYLLRAPAAIASGPVLSSLPSTPDSRTGLQAAIDFAVSKGAEARVPQGRWEISSDLFFRTGSRVVGAGMALTILALSSGAAADSAILRPENFDGVVHDFMISDLTLDGNVAGRGITAVTSSQRPGGSNFSLNGAYSGVVERVRSINANLHCFDICGPGEINADTGGREYVSPFNMDEDFSFMPGSDPNQNNWQYDSPPYRVPAYTEVAPLNTNWTGYPAGGYYPANAGPWVKFIDCEAENSGDDPFTTHYSRYIWIVNCRVKSGSNRHPNSAAGTSIGIEIDDGSRDIWVVGCHVAGCLKGIGVKAHDHNPAGRNIRVANCTVEACTVGISALDPYDPSPVSPTAHDVIFSDITIRNLAPQFGDTDLVMAIECQAYQGVIFNNITVDGNFTYSTTYGPCILLADAATNIIVSNVAVNGWNPGETDTTRPLISTSASCKAFTLRDIKFKESGGARGLVLNGTHYVVDGLFFGGPSITVASSYALLAAVHPLTSGGFIGHVSSENFTNTTRVAGVDSVDGQMVTAKEFSAKSFVGATVSGGMLNFGPRVTKTIASGVITVSNGSYIAVAGEGGANDDLVTINGADGDIVMLRAASSTVDIVVKHGTGNIMLDGMADFTLTHALDKLCLINDNGTWCEFGRGNNQT